MSVVEPLPGMKQFLREGARSDLHGKGLRAHVGCTQCGADWWLDMDTFLDEGAVCECGASTEPMRMSREELQ